jgi:poly-gamma-glutamate synthesis protein (capsule biosynthesis protein)
MRIGCSILLGAAALALSLVASASASQGAVRITPCASTEYTASIGDAPAQTPTQSPDQLTIVLVGDTGFNPKGAEVDPRGFKKNGKEIGFAESVSGVASDINGDLAFVNLETVITDRDDLEPDGKGQTSPYNFKSHPAGLRALLNTGFNLFSLANNHSMDYGPRSASKRRSITWLWRGRSIRLLMPASAPITRRRRGPAVSSSAT